MNQRYIRGRPTLGPSTARCIRLLPFASRIIVIASFVLLLLLLNQIQISNPFGNEKNAHESTPKLSKKKENALSLSHSERDRTLSLSLSLSFKIVYSFVSFVSFVANRRRCNKHTADLREKR